MALDFALTRRAALRLLSGAVMALATAPLASAQTASRTSSESNPIPTDPASFSQLTPELTEGPFYLDLERIRRDITEGRPGVPLRLRILVLHVTSGAPIPTAAVDVWHCDAQGEYSGFDHPQRAPFPPGPPPNGSPPPDGRWGFGPGPGRVHQPDNQLTFLRGVQLTGPDGLAEIDSIVPGWYPGRAPHIHVRVHSGGMEADGRYRKGHLSHTGQIFIPERITDAVYKLPAYDKSSRGRMALEQDGIFREGGGRRARVVPIDASRPERGFICDSLLVIDPAATPDRA
jgi:protocatechuate 3,4-dioxygenase beta subunit